ncbi:uncharacterized protein LOC125531059, partial [Triticum urartu]|uniref:uncharacterized protein LOC125531059 n=1 Tax=Triticum urartu TaxID=4572 RepID=UPI00204324E2
MGQGLSVAVDALSCQSLRKADIKPWLFSKKKGSKSLDADGKVDIFWDISAARFGAGSEPLEGFYVTLLFDLELALLLGDMKKDAYRKTGANRPALNAAFIARKEHIYGKKIYSAKAQFCDNGPPPSIARWFARALADSTNAVSQSGPVAIEQGQRKLRPCSSLDMASAFKFKKSASSVVARHQPW